MAALKLGWGKADITPIGDICKKVSLVGQFNERITDTVRDPISATALAIEASGGCKAILVSMDLGFITDGLLAAAREALAKLLPDFPVRSLILAATHIHTGPHLGRDTMSALWGPRFESFSSDPEVLSPEAFTDFAAGRAAQAAAAAWTRRKPGGVAAAFGRVAVPQCRRVCYKDGRAVMYGDTDRPDFLRIEGGADTGVEYIAVFDRAGKMTGAVVNLACPAQVIEHKEYISADLWGEVRRQWPECEYILPLCGAAGDVTMRDLVRRDRGEADMREPEGMELQAGRIVRESAYTLSRIQRTDILYDAPAGHAVRRISLPLMRVSEEEYQKAKVLYDAYERDYELNDFSAGYEDGVPLRMRDRVAYSVAAGVVARRRLQAGISVIDLEAHALRLADTALVTNPFELYQDYGMQIKARSPARQTLIAQLCCGQLGYLPTALGISGGSYSAGVSNGYFGPEGGQMYVEKALDMIGDLFESR